MFKGIKNVLLLISFYSIFALHLKVRTIPITIIKDPYNHRYVPTSVFFSTMYHALQLLPCENSKSNPLFGLSKPLYFKSNGPNFK